MKIYFSIALSAAIFTNVANAQSLFDYSAPATGSAKCALINVIMDESGSMGGDQTFLKNVALPKMATELHSSNHNYSDVFVCSSGFGYSRTNNAQAYRHLGCTTYNSAGVIANSTALAWYANGAIEDGWYAMKHGMQDVPSSINGTDLLSHCARVDKNLILVTDEDRDDAYSNVDATNIANLIDTNGYILNVIANYGINNNINDFGMNIGGGGSNSTIFRFDSSAPDNHMTYQDFRPYETYVTSFGGTHPHYTELIVDKPGAAWNINSLRSGGLRAQTFADIFVDIKVKEISNGTGGPSGGGGTVRVGGPEAGGDPHITTWNHKEHYEYHGQCDLVMVKDPTFADGLGLYVHIRTKIVRYWSYIQSVAIRIDDDVLEIEGSADAHDDQAHYWKNFEYQGDLDTFAGFPVTQKLPSVYKRTYTIDLSSKFPGQEITIQLYKEFVRVKLNGNEQVFGNSVGLLGDYKTGKTLARDGVTVLDDFTDLGDEWQVLPSEPTLFHEIAHPQFPELCLKPEDPRGERKRRLEESSISEEDAEKACVSLKDPLAIKDCVYDVLATQDVDMVGAF
ncbi:unnamed protein product [Cylindrotheca closterium]|uniref:VWFD domain-containing protein n=1 Tax=Cylindrotheca closterium TaxID=2856 RepID=A0AAD2JHD1_9STRA|nr:unnamed protein product [Cylindrotheca closterium]CAJ1948921.1 unnamed protein product [Cylindrotheca closterium]